MAMVDKHRCWGQRSETNRRIPFTKRPCLPRLCYLDDRRSLQFRSRVKIGIEQNVEGRKEGEVFNFKDRGVLWNFHGSIPLTIAFVDCRAISKRRFSLTPIIVLAEVIVTVALSLWLRDFARRNPSRLGLLKQDDWNTCVTIILSAYINLFFFNKWQTRIYTWYNSCRQKSFKTHHFYQYWLFWTWYVRIFLFQAFVSSKVKVVRYKYNYLPPKYFQIIHRCVSLPNPWYIIAKRFVSRDKDLSRIKLLNFASNTETTFARLPCRLERIVNLLK